MIHVVLRLFQIIYNDETQRQRDTGFDVLDNMSNERPDWYEYWPIRNFFERDGIHDGDFYGFFSPKFFAKTGLTRERLDSVIATDDLKAVFLFSPFLDASALFLNQIEQGQTAHPGLLDAFARLYPRPAEAPPLVQTVTNTVYCNYFVASGAFWRDWLNETDKVFVPAENPHSRLGALLRGETLHGGRLIAPMKVFCVERIVGTMLANDPRWHPVAPLAYQMPTDGPRFSPFRPELIALDQLKREAVRTGDYETHLRRYMAERRALMARTAPRQDGQILPQRQ